MTETRSADAYCNYTRISESGDAIYLRVEASEIAALP
jgi:hypothetical protein